MKNLETSKVPKLKFEHFLNYMLCVLRPAEGATYKKTLDFAVIGQTRPLVFVGFHPKYRKREKSENIKSS